MQTYFLCRQAEQDSWDLFLRLVTSPRESVGASIALADACDELVADISN